MPAMKVSLTSKTVGTGSSQMQVMVVYPKELTIKTSFEDATCLMLQTTQA